MKKNNANNLDVAEVKETTHFIKDMDDLHFLKRLFPAIFIVVIGIFVCTIDLFSEYEIAPTHQETEASEISSELGSINLDSLLDNSVDDYEGDADYDLEIKDYYVGFTNLDTVHDLLPLEAISDLSDDLAEFLNIHGYGDVHTLTVKEDSIVYDRSYPYFICTMDDIDNSFVEIRYDISKNEFEFSIVNAD